MQQIRPRCSVGIARFPQDGENLQSLLKAADSAMYAAKEEGKHRYAFYQPELTAKAEHRLQMEEDLGLPLPCNAVVYRTEDGKTMIGAIEAHAMLGVTGNQELTPVADEVAGRLRKAIDAV